MADPKLFTLDEARALLPRVKDELLAMQAAKRDIDVLRPDLQRVVETTSGNGHVKDEESMASKRRRAETLVQRINDGLARINGWGVEVKDLDAGLIDFASERKGRVVYLCWRMGEDDIEWWHELDDGFAGRQKL